MVVRRLVGSGLGARSMLDLGTVIVSFNQIPAAILRPANVTKFLDVGVAASDTVIALSRFNKGHEGSIASTYSSLGASHIKLSTLILE
jgi:hypothetical protein